MNNLKIVRTLALLATFMAFIVVMLGAATRLLDAGLGCPDWPGCYGRLVVPQAHIAAQYAPHAPLEAEKAWMEMIHRYLAASLGLMAMLLVFFSWRARTQASGLLRWTSLLLALVIVQGAFGAWTVTLKLWPQVVTLHLLGGFSCLYCSVLLLGGCISHTGQIISRRVSGAAGRRYSGWHWCCWYCR